MSNRLWVLLLSLCLPVASLRAAPSLETIMADPDWIGSPVEQAWFGLDGRHAYYRVKRAASPLRDLHRIDLSSGADRIVDDAGRAGSDGPDPVYDRQRRHAAFLRDGDVWLRELGSDRLHQLSRGIEQIDHLQFATDGRVLARAGQHWWLLDVHGPAARLVELHFEDDPLELDEDDALQATQLRLFAILERLRQERAVEREEDARQRRADASRAPAPWYLGKQRKPVTTLASPDRRWLLLVTRDAKDEDGAGGKMPRYVTESGYTEVEDVRSRVGRKTPSGEHFELLDLVERRRVKLDPSSLPGIGDDPLTELRRRDGAPEAPAQRTLELLDARWRDDGRYLALQLRAIDNKDRWLVTLEPGRDPAALRVQHRLSDPAWINWSFNDFGFLPGGDRLWYLSEQGGYSHLYVRGIATGTARALTKGQWEVHAPVASADGTRFWFIANAGHPGEYDLYTLAASGGEPQRLTRLHGVESFAVSTDQERLLLRHSRSYTPTQVALVEAEGGDPRLLTDTRTEAYRALQWPALEIVPVPSSHQSRPIWSKLYKPANMEPGRRYPAVLFVHGAGYTQNSHRRFPYYFREQMFHHLLVERGFVVLDMDYRASAGYGRDWRTAIYRQMGHPELEDLVDGIDWLAAEHQVDPQRIGVYGGSYGGFMSLMAMFREPGRFHAGAALRPVTDWRHYNHGYTSNILNTPELDPEAHRLSSPIEYAEGLAGPLLIAHGMLDDNVFYQDSVMLAQRLIELKKTDWELASYPLEPHSYAHAESWLDQYRRILKLFETHLLR